jgi:hypothetical protein
LGHDQGDVVEAVGVKAGHRPQVVRKALGRDR